jgi:pyrroloquinoline quinone (PQQ) biosynthesis protein C
MAAKTKKTAKAKAGKTKTTKRTSTSPLKAHERELYRLANAQFKSAAYKRMFAAPWTKKGVQEFFKQHAQFNLNRRDCWAYIQAAAPIEVKKLVWEHEEEELGGVPSRGGANHYELAVQQGASFGLKPKDYYDAPTLDGTFVASQAWLNLAQKSHWLEAFAASAALEYSNSETVIKGGCLSRRMGEKLRDELGIPMKKQYSNEEHVEADIAHGELLIQIGHMYGNSAEARAMIMNGAIKSWQIDRVFRDSLASLLEKCSNK